MPPTLRALPIAFALAAGTCCLPAAALAQSAPAPMTPQPTPHTATDTDTNIAAMRLTDAQQDEILDANTEERAAAARGESIGYGSDSLVPGGIHGEMGVMIGSHGTRGIYGTADIPLGENGGATIMFENSRYGYGRSRRTPR